MSEPNVVLFSWAERLRVFLAVEPSLRRSFLIPRLGHVYLPVGWARLDSDSLRVRREPLLVRKNLDRASWMPSVSSWKYENPIERFFPIVDGVQDRRFRHTPHYRLLESYASTGQRSYDGDYTRLLMVRARLQGRERSLEFVRAKVDALCATFDSIRARGYLGGEFANRPITVLEHPLQPQRGCYTPRNWEVFDGHHRAASLALLDGRDVRALIVRPVRVNGFDLTEDVAWDDARWFDDGAPARTTVAN